MAVQPVSSTSTTAPARKSRKAAIPAPYNKYASEVLAASKKYKIPPQVLFGMMMRESNGQNIRGDGGHGRGLMQIDDRSHADWLASHKGGMDPASNIMYAAQVLRESMDAFGGDLRKGLSAYNAGVGGVESALHSGRSADSATTGGDYASSVLRNAEQFRKGLAGVSAASANAPAQAASNTTRATASASRARRSSDTVAAHTLLKEGSRGAEVKELQQRLRDAGMVVPVNGIFDAKTNKAVRAYQSANGLQVDGLVGQQTWGSFFGQSFPPGTRMLKGGSSAVGGSGFTMPTPAPTSGGKTDDTKDVSDNVPEGKKAAIKKMLDVARSKVGIHEGAGNSNPFSRAMGRPGEAWCADFVSYVAKSAGLNTVNTASAQGIQDQLAAKGRWKGLRNPQPGDAVTFNWSGSRGWADHVGIVEKVFTRGGRTYIQTIEGNSSDQVRRKTYLANDPVVKGYGTIA
ncbi:MAG: peptidoglycan-binding protein [Myxococcaceae bacterium]